MNDLRELLVELREDIDYEKRTGTGRTVLLDTETAEALYAALIDADHEWALWFEKWKAAVEIAATYGRGEDRSTAPWDAWRKAEAEVERLKKLHERAEKLVEDIDSMLARADAIGYKAARSGGVSDDHYWRSRGFEDLRRGLRGLREALRPAAPPEEGK